MALTSNHNGEMRTGIERRQFFYFQHIPERRSGKDRRTDLNRLPERGSTLKYSKERWGILKIKTIINEIFFNRKEANERICF